MIENRSRWRIHNVATCRQAVEYLKEHPLGVVISDENLPDGDWKRLLNETERLPYRPNLIVSASKNDDHLWSEVLNLGAYDMLITPFDADEVFEVGTAAWRIWWDRIELAARRRPPAREPLARAAAASPSQVSH
jgi:DNA-binding NtrC family response regulator